VCIYLGLKIRLHPSTKINLTPSDKKSWFCPEQNPLGATYGYQLSGASLLMKRTHIIFIFKFFIFFIFKRGRERETEGKVWLVCEIGIGGVLDGEIDIIQGGWHMWKLLLNFLLRLKA